MIALDERWEQVDWVAGGNGIKSNLWVPMCPDSDIHTTLDGISASLMLTRRYVERINAPIVGDRRTRWHKVGPQTWDYEMLVKVEEERT